MKKFIGKISLLLLVLFVGISLIACDDKTTNENLNKKVAYGDLNSEVAYASMGELKLTEKTLYDELRVNGYDYLLDEMINKLVPTDGYSLEDQETYDALVKIVKEQCYGTSDEKKLAEMNTATKTKAEKQFADSMYLLGVDIVENGNINIFHEDCLKHFVKNLAQKEFVRSLLTTTTSKYYYKNEFQKDKDGNVIKDENGKDVKNPYYINEDAIESSYNSNKDSESKYNVVIIGYNTLQDAENAFNGLDLENLTYDNFKTLYENRYSYKAKSEDNFKLTSGELNKYNSSLVSLIKNINDNFDKLEKTYKIEQQFSGVVYAVYLNEKFVEADYEALSDEEKANEYDATIEDSTAYKMVDSKLTTSTISSLLFEQVYEADVVINDFVFDALYAAENKDHKRLDATKFDNANVATINGKAITVRDFYNKLVKIMGISTAMDYFTSETLLNSEFKNKLTSDDLKNIDKEYNDTKTAFENDEFASNGYPASIGLDVFNFVYYGTTDEAQIKEYYKSQEIWNYYLKDKPEEYYNLLYEFGKQYAGYTTVDGENKTDVEGKYFDLSVKHILLTVDYDGDGNSDDPEIYMSKLSADDQTALLTAIKEAMVAIVEEVNYLVEEDKTTLLKALDFVQERFHYSGDLGKLESNPSKNWDDYKTKFNLNLKIEDLGSVNNTSASRYVNEFSIGVQKLYAELKEKSLLNDDYLYGEILEKTVEGQDEPVDTTHEERLASIEKELIPTSFGYHILASYNSSTLTSAKYTESNDTSKQYQNIKVKLNGVETVIENAYSDEEKDASGNYVKYASLNQIKIYDAQIGTDDGVTDLPPGAKTFIGKIYSDFNSKYTNSTFKNILYAYTYLLDSLDSTTKANVEKFLEIQIRQFDQYVTEDVNNISIFANWWDLVLPKAE